MKNIFFDLDGTLLDSKLRLYMLFNELTGNQLLSFEEYWYLKKSMRSNQWILENFFKTSTEEIDHFTSRWMSRIEEESLLSNDTLFGDALDVLDYFKDENLYLVTARQSKTHTVNQLRKLEIYDYFKAVLITENSISKQDLIRQESIPLNQKNYFIGDTGEDINTAKMLGLVSIATTTGFRSSVMLKKYSPDFMIDKLSEIKQIIHD